jgi:hypothetical protein
MTGIARVRRTFSETLPVSAGSGSPEESVFSGPVRCTEQHLAEEHLPVAGIDVATL